MTNDGRAHTRSVRRWESADAVGSEVTRFIEEKLLFNLKNKLLELCVWAHSRRSRHEEQMLSSARREFSSGFSLPLARFPVSQAKNGTNKTQIKWKPCLLQNTDSLQLLLIAYNWDCTLKAYLLLIYAIITFGIKAASRDDWAQAQVPQPPCFGFRNSGECAYWKVNYMKTYLFIRASYFKNYTKTAILGFTWAYILLIYAIITFGITKKLVHWLKERLLNKHNCL